MARATMPSRISISAAAMLVAASYAAPTWSEPSMQGAVAARKSDRLVLPRRSALREVASVSTSGHGGSFVATMRDRSGVVVYHAETATRTTAVVVGSVLPAIPVPDTLVAATSAPPTPPVARTGAVPAGCERIVSVLVRSAAAQILSRCVT